MIQIQNKSLCCGCGVCTNVCPVKCISMQPDKEGFCYPIVDSTICIKCGLCIRVCPFTTYNVPKDEITQGYIGRIKENKYLDIVASGGIYTAISMNILSCGGFCVGVEYKNGECRHSIIDSLEDISNHSSSKYTQSNTHKIYFETKKLLEEKKIVLFSGTPCQIVALKKYLSNEYDNLYTIDVLCAGVCSPKVFRQYIEVMEKQEKSKIKKINFKKKTYGYHSSTMHLDFVNEEKKDRSRLTDEMMHIYTAHIADRPSCSVCKIKGISRVSDLTIFDCWHFSQISKLEDDDRGYSNIIVHSIKGKNLLDDAIKFLEILPCDFMKAVELDGNMFTNIQKPHKNREQFFLI